ncbi:MAG: aminotransferase class III-fold pyridoxal phosphate-dependent enzyme [Bacteroidetes bacterium]|nr:aminotransferase class III-fold pyridoxal phosphate-dependent enzyme [Bacteroidota bacterium]
MPNRVAFNEDYPSIDRSNDLYNRALGLIPCVTQTLAKGPGQHVNGVAPKYLVRGKGTHVWDADGNEFLDYTMGVGPISLGYCYEAVDNAVREQLESGITFSLMHPLEVEVAELIRSVVPNAESVRFSKTGCDVTTAAVRLARAFTGRDKVLCCGYHGWHDWYIAVTDRNRGIPEAVADLTHTINYNDIASLADSIDGETACVILEPTVFEAPRDGYLQKVRELCDANGALLVFDEMWTGFRLALGGAQEYFQVNADLACFSKAIANGMPISVLSGRHDVMALLEHDVFFFTTFGGEALSLAAAKATINEMRERHVTEHLWRQGGILKHGYNEIAAELGMEYTGCVGLAPRTMVTFNASAGDPLLMKSLVQQEMIKRGILWSGFHTISFSHSNEDIAYTLVAYREVLPILKQAVAAGTLREQLRGAPVEPVFRRTGNFNMKPAPQKNGVVAHHE